MAPPEAGGQGESSLDDNPRKRKRTARNGCGQATHHNYCICSTLENGPQRTAFGERLTLATVAAPDAKYG
jgi:hypothetical protein